MDRAEYIEAVVNAAPPLTPAQATHLQTILLTASPTVAEVAS